MKPIREKWVFVHELRISAPVLLLLYSVIGVGYDTNMMGIPDEVGELPGAVELKLIKAFAVQHWTHINGSWIDAKVGATCAY